MSAANRTTSSTLSNLTTVTTKTVYRMTPACAITWSNNTVITLSADLAIVTDGSLTSVNQVNLKTADSTVRNLFLIMPTGTPCPGGNLTLSNNTTLDNIRFLLNTPCTATINNNNNGVGGQIYAGTVSTTNLYTMNFDPLIIPGAGVITGFKVDIAFIREIVNP